MRGKLTRASALVVCLVSTGACASSSGSSTVQGAPKAEIIPATLKSTGGPVVLYMQVFHGTVEVPIDETGRPVTSEARFIGNASSDARREITAWLERLSFEPATRNGVPVRGSFKMKFK